MFARKCTALASRSSGAVKREVKRSNKIYKISHQRNVASKRKNTAHGHGSASRELQDVSHVSHVSHGLESTANKPHKPQGQGAMHTAAWLEILQEHSSTLRKSNQRGFSTSSASSSWSSFDSPVDSPVDTPPQQSQQSQQSQPHSTFSPIFSEMQEIVDNGSARFSLEELRQLAIQPCTPLSLADMYKYASANVHSKNYFPQRLRNAQFLYQEIPIRIAHRAVDLLTLPHGLNKTPPVQAITHQYLTYLEMFKTFPMPQNDEEELQFTKLLQQIVLKRNSIPEAISKGVFALKDNRTEGLDEQLQAMEKALYRFFNARTGLRLIAEHHILSCTQLREENLELKKNQSWSEKVKHESDFGCIQKNCDPTTEARKVADEIMEQCRTRYGISPQIEIIDCTPDQFLHADFTYVPHHLQYMLAELLRNSCRATVKRYMEGTNEETGKSSSHLPSIRVVVAKGAEDVTIKIADKGGGVPRSVIDKMWTFAHSTLSDAMDKNKSNDTHLSEIDEFTGRSVSGRGFNIRGFGLPLARIYARYFGGELTLKSMEGYGVDAYLYLPVLGVKCENLPKRVLKSPGQNDSIHDGNHHVYQGDSFSMSADEPWGNSARHYSTSTESLKKKLAKVAL